jgi:hypothetical protein
MINGLIFLIGIAIIVIGFAIFDHFTLARTYRKNKNTYVVRARRDELVYLAAEQKISVNDPLFAEMFQFLESFESVCDHISLKHLFEDLSRRKVNPLDVSRFEELRQRIDASHAEVKPVVLASIKDTAHIMIANSLTLKFLFYLLRITVFKRLPHWLRNWSKSLVGPLWNTAKGLIALDQTFGLKPART